VEDLKARYAEWTNFTDSRETERKRLMAPNGTAELRQQIKDQQAVVLQEQAKLQMLKAQLVIANAGETPYQKTLFDYEWSLKKAALKLDVEKLMAEEIQRGTSIPKIMKALGCKNATWLYAVRDNIELYRGASKEEMVNTKWEWSDVIAVHRYALGCAPDSSEWAFVLLHGALDTEYEDEQCVFDFKTGHFISGSRGVFDDVTEGVKAMRSKMLAEILEGVYAKKTRRDTNPYFEQNN
jgi:hypothetical protein